MSGQNDAKIDPKGGSENGNQIPQNGIPLPSKLGHMALPELEGPAQTALAWDAAGAPVVRLEPTKIKQGRGREMRGDARRTAEYLATRGPTPVEALHDVARMKWRTAIREIKREANCTGLEAMRMWFQCANALLPHTSARLDTVELGANAAGGLALAHWLAATAIGNRLVEGGSHNGPMFDNTVTAAAQSDPSSEPSAAPLLELPPAAPD